MSAVLQIDVVSTDGETSDMAGSEYKIEETRDTKAKGLLRKLAWLIAALCTIGGLIGLVVDLPGFVQTISGARNEPTTVTADIVKNGLKELVTQEEKAKEK